MEKTKKLFDSMPYETEFEAEIIAVESASNQIKVVLNQTLFFPEEGGQTPDRGTINGCEVTDVRIENGIITHYISGPDEAKNTTAIEVGARVFGKIDWDRRFYNMQNHSGEHIISGTLFRWLGSNNVGFHLSDHLVTVDTSRDLTKEELLELEIRVNDVIYRNVPIKTGYPSPEELKGLEYRCKGEIEGPVRLVEIEGVDLCACCAPHVANTGEIGLIKIIKAIRYKGGTRLTIICGSRAFKYVQELYEQNQTLSHFLSEPPEKVAEAVERLSNELGEARVKLSEMQKRLIMQQIERIPAETANVWLFSEELEPVVQRNAVNALVEGHGGYCGIMVGNDEEGYRYIVGSSGNDAREISNLFKAEFGAKGGGKPEMVQGAVEAEKNAILGALKRNGRYL
ncbi:MAG: hypothetical protein K5985_11585 [Lachnospiraceae bacterium]|nr:hypothetical protein [Lachnospiraceae bacterium]